MRRRFKSFEVCLEATILACVLVELTAAEPVRVEVFSAAIEGHCTSPRLSPDGRTLAYERWHPGRKTRDVVLLSLADRVEEIVAPMRSSAFGLLEAFDQTESMLMQNLRWTPAGPFLKRHRFVVVGNRSASSPAIYLSDLGRLTDHVATEGHPAWSPVGGRLAYVSSLTGEGDLYLVDLVAEPGEPIRLTHTSADAELFPVWSPNGKTLCFVRHTARGDNLHLLEASDPGHPVERGLTRWSGTQTKPSWSPHGDRIAFYSNHENTDGFDLFVLEVSGTASPRRLVSNVVPSERDGPVWLPGGEGLLSSGEQLLVVLDDSTRLDPIVRIDARSGKVVVLKTDTLNNSDPSIGVVGGRRWIFFSAQGRGDELGARQWRRVYGGEL